MRDCCAGGKSACDWTDKTESGGNHATYGLIGYKLDTTYPAIS